MVREKQGKENQKGLVKEYCKFNGNMSHIFKVEGYEYCFKRVQKLYDDG